ncbi:hypothetical protein [Paenibacillus koleovorans]|uniref:hypothetical protein n=1 Tax=Paenibacillus koleovorans TaxID=121608 RepID=UPI000FD885B2|nr:hypothetical protein [Paenibacillus koleovorans]
MRASESSVSVYFAAGISMMRTSKMFHDAMNDIERRYREKGLQTVRFGCFYPYGTMDEVPLSKQRRFIAKQVLTVGMDIYRQAAHTIGGQTLFQDIRKAYDPVNGGGIVLIGHSGGGIASYKAAQLLNRIGYPVRRVFMIGSPEIPICRDCRDKVLAVEHSGRWGDWISRCAFHWFRPAKIRVRLPIRGGHPHYFCSKSKDENNVTNMQKMTDFLWSWMQGEESVTYSGANT